MRAPNRDPPEFRHERDMLKPVAAWLGESRLTWRAEFILPWGICDVMGIALASERIAKRLALGQRRPIGPPERIALWLALPDEGDHPYPREPTLARACMSLEPDQVTEELQELIRHGFARRASGAYFRMNGWAPMHTRIVAVELKLERTADALAQAKRHRLVATESYVAMPGATAERIAVSRRAADFLEAGTGLLGVQTGDCRIVLPAIATQPDSSSAFEMHVAERFWRSRSRGS